MDVQGLQVLDLGPSSEILGDYFLQFLFLYIPYRGAIWSPPSLQVIVPSKSATTKLYSSTQLELDNSSLSLPTILNVCYILAKVKFTAPITKPYSLQV